MVPGGNPVIEVPGDTPTPPMIMLGPVFVTVEPPRTAKFAADPSGRFWAKEHAADKRNTLNFFTSSPLRLRASSDVTFAVLGALEGRRTPQLIHSSFRICERQIQLSAAAIEALFYNSNDL